MKLHIKQRKGTSISFRFKMVTTRTRDCLAETSIVELQFWVSIITAIIIVGTITIINDIVSVSVSIVSVRIHWNFLDMNHFRCSVFKKLQFLKKICNKLNKNIKIRLQPKDWNLEIVKTAGFGSQRDFRYRYQTEMKKNWNSQAFKFLPSL
jgi:hypothetical protein